MPNIPGLSSIKSGIPRLGQGVPGGEAGMTGLPGGPDASAIPGLPAMTELPSLSSSRQSSLSIPAPALDTPGTVHLDSGALAHTRQRLDAAMKILLEVRSGHLEPEKAASMLDELTPNERRTLTQTVLKNNANNGLAAQPELRALRYLPMGKDPGATASLDPTRRAGIGANLANDAFNTVVGLPAGLGLAGVAVGKDVGNIASDPTGGHHFEHTYNDILKPMAQSYKQTYGPALHGDFSGLAQHPLMPILDAASIVSGGLGAAARVGDAAEALRAARVVHVPGEGVLKIGDKAITPAKGIKVEAVPNDVESRRTILHEVDSATWKDSGAYNYATSALINGGEGKVFIARDAKTGKLLGIAHHDPAIGGESDTSTYLHNIASTGEKPGVGKTLIHAVAQDALDSGKTHINLQSARPAEDFYRKTGFNELLPGQDAGYFSGDITKEPTFVSKVGAPNGKVTMRQTLNDLRARLNPRDFKAIEAISKNRKIPFHEATDYYFRGNDPEYYTVHEHPPKLGPSEVPMNVTETGTNGAITKLWNHLDDNPNFDVDHFESLLNRLGQHAHEDFNFEGWGTKQVRDPAKFLSQLGGIAEHARSLATSPEELARINSLVDEIYKSIKTPVPIETMKAAAGPARTLNDDLLDTLEPKFGGDVQGGHPRADPMGDIGRQDPNELLAPYATSRDLPKRYSVRQRGKIVAQNFPDRESAIKHAQSLISPYALKRTTRAAATNETREQLIQRLIPRLKNAGHHELAGELEDQLTHGGHEVQFSYPTVHGTISNVPELDRALESLVGEHHGEIVEAGSGLGGRDYSAQFKDPEDAKTFIHELVARHPEMSEEFGIDNATGRAGYMGHPITKEGVEHLTTKQDLLDWFHQNGTGQFADPGFAHALKHVDPPSLAEATTASRSPVGAALTAFAKGGGARGRLIDRYDEARGFNHEAEVHNMMNEVADVLGNNKLRMDRRSVGQVAKEVWGDIQQTRRQGKARGAQIAADNPGFFNAKPVQKGLATGETALREASDLVRAGAIYLRPAYLPNNWVGNFFMNAVHQGMLAPVNLAKSLVMDKYIGKQYTAAIDKAMGQNAAEVVTAAKGRGYVGSITNPVAHSMGMLADQPFRRAAFLHEARRAGYSKLDDVRKLMDRAATHETSADGAAALKEVAQIGRRAQEEIVKFNHFNDTERQVVRNLIFVYSWVRGSARYAARFGAQHPIQSDVFQHLSNDVGQPYLNKELGGVPSYLLGAIPVGHDKNGNPILINPFSLNPLGTAVDVARAAHGTYKVLSGDRSFNKFVDTDVANLTNPLIQNYLTAREGGKKPIPQLEQTIAPVRLAHDLMHPGTGSVFPTSRTEALGHFTVGALFPRVADQQALTKSLEREQRNDPIARIPTDINTYRKLTGDTPDPDLVNQYRADLVQVQKLKDFQLSYATKHGQSGFRNLPPANRVDAAIKFLAQNKLARPSELAEYQREAKQMTSDAELSSLASSLFSSTGIGEVKSAWDQMMSDARGMRLSRQRG